MNDLTFGLEACPSWKQIDIIAERFLEQVKCPFCNSTMLSVVFANCFDVSCPPKYPHYRRRIFYHDGAIRLGREDIVLSHNGLEIRIAQYADTNVYIAKKINPPWVADHLDFPYPVFDFTLGISDVLNRLSVMRAFQ